MHPSRGLDFLATLLFLSVWPAARGGDFFVHDGDRVVFLGDSITQQQLYTTYIEAYALTRHPAWKLVFRNVGWGGDTAWLRQRIKTDPMLFFSADDARQHAMAQRAVEYGLGRDVFPLRPTVVTVNFGMNDFGYQPLRADILRAYICSQTEVAHELAARGVRAAFLTPQPIEDKRPDPDQDERDVALKAFSAALGKMAAAEGVRFVDQFTPYMQTMLASRTGTIGGGEDAVHPGPPGHTVMAWAILKSLGANALVSTLTIDRETGQVTVQACQVQNLQAQGDQISFDRLDAALPMPVDAGAGSALKIIPFTRDLNVYELTVVGLSPGQYQLSIDGEAVATVSSDELAAGWNLAYSAGPITRQAADVLAAIKRKNNLYFTRWREVQLFEAPNWLSHRDDFELQRRAELARLDQQIAELEAVIDSERQPKSHHFQILRVVRPTIVSPAS